MHFSSLLKQGISWLLSVLILAMPLVAQADTVFIKMRAPSSALHASSTDKQEAAPIFSDWPTALDALLGNNFADKQAAVVSLPELQPPHLLSMLTALSEGRLYADSQKNLFVKNGTDEQFAPLNDLTRVHKQSDGLKKVVINHQIRQWAKAYVAEHALQSDDVDMRKNAITQMLQQHDDGALVQVQTALPKESNAQVRELMHVYLARSDLKQHGDISRHSAAMNVLSKSASPEDLALLQNYMQTAPTPELKQQAQKAISALEHKQLLLSSVETLSFGLSLGSILVLTAIGLAITFGVMGVINMAHGELMMIGAYCAYVVQQLMPNAISWSIVVAIPVAFVVSGLVGVLIERLVVRHLYGRPLETLLATFGVSLILQQAVRSIFSPLNRLVQTPEWMSGSVEIARGLSITWNRIYIFVFCLLCFLVLWAVMNRSRLGLEVRAVSLNRSMARAMGINDRRVDMLTFGLGSGIAGVAGVALSQLTNVGVNLGQQYIVDSFMVVVVGGVGNLWGTLVSGLTLGVLNKALEPWLGAVLAKAIVLVLIILFIQKYPRGLFPQKGRSVE